MPKNKIPQRWQRYEPLGTCISGTKLIALKVPLKKEICENLPPYKRFTPQTLIERVSMSGHLLGLVIDLTNTSRYYNPQEFTRAGIEYQKLFTEGHVIPKTSIVQSFTRIVQEFTSKSSNNGRLIGVHCTHGINRTGYLICRYMVEHLGFTASDALKAFADGRGYKIERQNYIDNLHEISEAKQTSYKARSRVMHFDESSSLTCTSGSQDIERSNLTAAQCASNLKKVRNISKDSSSSRKITERSGRKRKSHPYSFTQSTDQRNQHVYKSQKKDDMNYHGCPSSQDTHHRPSSRVSSSRNYSFPNYHTPNKCKYAARESSQVHVQHTNRNGNGHYRQYEPVDNGLDAYKSTWSQRPSGQSAWSRFHDYRSYRMPMHLDGHCNQPESKHCSQPKRCHKLNKNQYI